MSLGGTKIHGRYLKKGSITLDKVKITPFSFEALPDSPAIQLDNPQKNIVHASLHEEQELQRSIVIPKEMSQELIEAGLKAPIVFPRNFTKDWNEDRKRQKKRGLAHYEDEDDTELTAEKQEFENTTDKGPDQENDAASKVSFTATTLEREMQASAAGEFVPGIPGALGTDHHKDGQGEQTDFESFASLQRPGRMSIDASMDMVGKAIQDLAAHDIRARTESHQSPSAEGDSFIPVNVGALQEGQGLEDSAIAEYERQRLLAQIDVDAIKQEAQAQGYESGFRVGEERSTLQYREKIEALFKNVNILVDELAGLKHDILEQVQTNFHEISQAMCEALMDRAISIDPTVFADVMKRAISEAVEGETIKIRVSPKMAGLLSKVEIGDRTASITADHTLAEDEFRIDSKLGVVDASIRKIIRDLLDQADINIFDAVSKAG